MFGQRLLRREWLGRSLLGLFTPAFLPRSGMGVGAPQAEPPEPESEYSTYFGDLHNHNSVGYARGSLERSFAIAEHLLDFFAFTPHAHWHDIGQYEGNIEQIWHTGFKITRERWDEVLQLHQRYDRPGSFVPIPGYEWHSTDYGDYHVLFPSLKAELFTPDDLESLQKFVRRAGAIMIPHHLANRQGKRGANFDTVLPELSPLIEVYSEWGNAVSDRGPYPYTRHSHGGRWTRNTFEYRLSQGDRFGIVASTDDHLGKPGAYPQGLAAVQAKELTRPALFQSFRKRRTYAVTGDRILLDFKLNGHPMGAAIPSSTERKISVNVTGWHQINVVEVSRNNRVIQRKFPQDAVVTSGSWNKPLLLWCQFGWGPWAALPFTGIAEWDVDISLEGGRIQAFQPAFLSGPYSEDHRDRVELKSKQQVHLESFTARQQEFEDRNHKGLALKLLGQPDSLVTITIRKPGRKTWKFHLQELAESSQVLYTGPYPRESILLERLVFCEHFQTSFTVEDEPDGEEVHWYRVRVEQANGQYAWSSPIWVEAAG